MASTQNQQVKSFWLDYVEQWQSSGFSQVACCRMHSLCQQKFSYRKRQSSFCVENSNTSRGFSRVQVDYCISPSVSDIGLSLRFNDGISIEGITESNLALVQLLPAVGTQGSYLGCCCQPNSYRGSWGKVYDLYLTPTIQYLIRLHSEMR